MPVDFIDAASTSQADAAATGTITATIPAGAENGDLLVLWVAARGLSSAGATTIDRPTGWTRLGTTQVYSITATGRMGTSLFYRTHDEAEPTVTVTYGAAWRNVGEVVGASVAVFRGQPPAIWSGSVAESSTATETPGPDPLPTQRAMILSHYAKVGTIAYTAPSPWTAAYGNSVSPSGGGAAWGCHYLAADPGTYTMPTTRNLRASVAIIDTPAGGWVLGLKLGGGAGWHVS